MRKAIDLLSRDLAGGMSRRKALWKFITGAGAVGAVGALSAQKAHADSHVTLTCQIFCHTQSQQILSICRTINGNNVAREVICNGIADEFLSDCLAAASRCRSGLCAEFVGINGTFGISPSTYSLFVDGGGGFICVPSGGGVV